MKIIRYKKEKQNTYKVELDNGILILYDDIIVKYALLLKKELTKEEYMEIKQENQKLKCYYQALEYIHKKMRSENEVNAFLKKEGYPKEDITKTICRLKKEKYINDSQYIELFLNNQIRLSTDGPRKISEKLQKLGLENALIEQYLETIEPSIWQEKCQKIIEKKQASNHKDSKELFKQRLKKYLLQNGYEPQMIDQTIASIELKTPPEALKKEYAKLKRKLERKYTGATLEYQLKMKLRIKGYTDEELQEIIN